MSIKECPLCRNPIQPWEDDPDEDSTGFDAIRPDGAGVCSECYGRWHDYTVIKNRNAQLEALLLDSRDAKKMEKALLDSATALKMVEEIQAVLNRAGSFRATAAKSR